MSDRDGNSTELEVFLVENNVSDLFLMMKYLKDCAAKPNVTIARNGREAMDYLHRVNGYERSRRPDIVLTELSLPYQNGFDLLRSIKETPALQDVRVIIITHSTSPEDASKARRLKVDDYLVKPQTLPEFDALIKKLEENWLKKTRD